MSDTPLYSLIIDPENREVGCALIQAMTDTNSHDLLWMFDPSVWFLSPRPGMVRMTGTMEEWKNTLT